MSGCANVIPAIQVSTGSSGQLNNVSIEASFGFIRYDTTNHNLEVYEENGWKDIVINDKPAIDISGKLVVDGDVSLKSGIITFPDGTSQRTARPPYKFINYSDKTDYDVKKGNPSDTIPNEFFGEISEMALSIDIPNNNTDVMITANIVGEWEARADNKGLAIHRKRVFNGVTSQTIIRAPDADSRGRIISTFSINLENDSSTMEVAVVNHMDTVDAGTITYTPILINTNTTPFSTQHIMNLNHTWSAAGTFNYEVGISTLIVQAMS